MSHSVNYESTPNPQAMKFIVAGPALTDESANFSSLAEAARSPLAKKLFGFPWAAGVFIGPNFVTVTKQDWVKWEVLAEPLADLIAEHLNRGEAVLTPQTTPSTLATSEDSPIVRQIKEILETDVRPAVAMDGGDITFSRYDNGKLYLHMHGSCSGCPSSTLTLKEGIETRMRSKIPEIVEVIAV